jgi:hypothetical protein
MYINISNTFIFIENLKKELRVSQSELMRRAIRFFYENRATVGSVDREKARSHAEQFNRKVTSPQALLLRLEACNLFKLSHTGDKEFTLMTGPGTQRRFIREFLEEAFAGMGFNAVIKEDYSKLRVIIQPDAT